MTDDLPSSAPPSWANAPSPLTVSLRARRALEGLSQEAEDGDLEAHRDRCASVQRDLGGHQLQRYGVEMRDGVIAGVPVRVFTPRHAAPDQTGGQGVLLNLHGGGFIVDAGSVTENAPIAALTGLRVVAVRYRLAPEHPYPAAVDDAETVYRALVADHPTARIGLYGTSAGACLAAQLLVRLRLDGLPMPAVFGFFTGTADLSRAGDSEHFFRPMEAGQARPLFADYVGPADRADPRVSPIFSDLEGFPPTLCLAGTRDFMLSQTALFHQALLAAGVDTELRVFEAMPHAHWIFLDLPESDSAFEAMAGFFRRHLGGAAGVRRVG